MNANERAKKLERARIRRDALKEPRDWQSYWWAYLLHVLQGGIAGSLAMVSVSKSNMEFSVLAFTITSLYIAYQGLSFARKHDTVGRDLADYGIGWAIGAVLCHAIYWIGI